MPKKAVILDVWPLRMANQDQPHQLEDVTVHLPEAKLEEYKEIFSFFDRDGGGTITTVELGQVMRTFGWTPSESDLQVSSDSTKIFF